MIYSHYLQERIMTVSLFQEFFIKKNVLVIIPGLETPFQTIAKRLKKIQSLDCFGYAPSSEAKKSCRSDLAMGVSELGNAVFAYASITKNAVLKNAIQYSYSDIYRSKENTMLGRCRQVINAARKIKNGEKFGIYQRKIDEVQEAYDKFLDIMHNPTANIKKRKREYIQMDKLLAESLHIIDNEIMPLVLVLDKSLYNSLKISRKIWKTAGRRRKYVRKNIAPQITQAPNPQQQQTEIIPLQDGVLVTSAH
jgi:hypothetical protein